MPSGTGLLNRSAIRSVTLMRSPSQVPSTASRSKASDMLFWSGMPVEMASCSDCVAIWVADKVAVTRAAVGTVPPRTTVRTTPPASLTADAGVTPMPPVLTSSVKLTC